MIVNFDDDRFQRKISTAHSQTDQMRRPDSVGEMEHRRSIDYLNILVSFSNFDKADV